MKCAVKDCTNYAHEGKFIGLLCSPCHNFITGERGGGRSQACRNTQYKIDEAVKAERDRATKICEYAMQMYKDNQNLSPDQSKVGFLSAEFCAAHIKSGESWT